MYSRFESCFSCSASASFGAAASSPGGACAAPRFRAFTSLRGFFLSFPAASSCLRRIGASSVKMYSLSANEMRRRSPMVSWMIVPLPHGNDRGRDRPLEVGRRLTEVREGGAKRGAGNLDQPRVGSVHLPDQRVWREQSRYSMPGSAANVASRLLARDIKKQVEEALKEEELRSRSSRIASKEDVTCHRRTTRIEHDLLGDKAVPADAYYGVQTARALENFHISGVELRLYPNLIKAFAMVKMAAARANFDCGAVQQGDPARESRSACQEIIDGKLHDEFRLDVFQGGAGTSTNMNANEVIANRALELMGHKKGEYKYCDPHDHVNCSQSTNDAYPSALHVGMALGNQRARRRHATS